MKERELLEAFAKEYWNKKFAPSIESDDIDSFLASRPEEKAYEEKICTEKSDRCIFPTRKCMNCEYFK